MRRRRARTLNDTLGDRSLSGEEAHDQYWATYRRQAKARILTRSQSKRRQKQLRRQGYETEEHVLPDGTVVVTRSHRPRTDHKLNRRR